MAQHFAKVELLLGFAFSTLPRSCRPSAEVGGGSALEARGYAPEAGLEGTFKDLRSLRRIGVVLDTNIEMARGYGAWLRQQSALGAFPAWRYVRGRRAMVLRDWPARWNDALDATTEAGATVVVADDENSMAALVNHLLWSDAEFNSFGTPYSPFDFGLGMSVNRLSCGEAKARGLLPDDDDDEASRAAKREMMKPAESRSLNESLQVSPKVESPALRKELAERLQGFGKWEDGKLLFTDPNGTRPVSSEDLAVVLSEGLPDGPRSGEPWPLMQRLSNIFSVKGC